MTPLQMVSLHQLKPECSTMVQLIPHYILEVHRSSWVEGQGREYAEIIFGHNPATNGFPSRYDQNVQIPGAGMPAMSRTAYFVVYKRKTTLNFVMIA